MYHDAGPYHTHIREVQEIRALLITAKYAKFRAEIILFRDVYMSKNDYSRVQYMKRYVGNKPIEGVEYIFE